MSNLPFTLPTCTNAANARVEVYTPAPGDRYGSLDASVYTCPEHTDSVRATIEAAGFATYPVPLSPDVKRVCGAVHVFRTGKLISSAHPQWCDEKECERRREHRSPTLPVDTGHPESTVLHVALVRPLHGGDEPVVSVTGINGDTAAHLAISVGQARVLRYRLGNLIDAAKSDQR